MRGPWTHRLDGGPTTLGAARIVVALLVLFAPEAAVATALAHEPWRMVVTPEGMGWLVARLPRSFEWVHVALVVMRASAALTVLGMGGRPVRVAMALTALAIFSFSQRTGVVLHNMHVVWFAWIVAFAPSDDALSLVAWVRRGLVSRDPRAYRVPLLGMRALLGTVYFFPGLQKLVHGGSDWWSGRILLGQMHFKWYEAGRVLAPFRVDHSPALLAIGATSVLLFELTFPVLAIVRRLRPLAIAGGLVFHFVAARWLGIPFVSLWAFYVVLVDIDGAVEWIRARVRARAPNVVRAAPTHMQSIAPTPPERLAPRWTRVTAVGVGLLLMGQCVQGARGNTQGYPFACYPTFADRPPREVPDVDVSVTDNDGTKWLLFGKRAYSQSEWGELWRDLGVYDGIVRSDALRTFVIRDAARRGLSLPTNGAEVRVFRSYYAVEPDTWGAQPSSRTLVAVW